MRDIIIISFFSLCVIACNNKDNKNREIGHLRVIKGECNIGNIQPDTVINGYFIVQNTSDKVIYYKNYYSGCNCTKLVDKKDSLVSGGVDTIRFLFNSRGLKEQVIIKDIRVITNSKPEMTKLRIIGNVISEDSE